MSEEFVIGMQLGFYGLVIILFLVLLGKLERISTLLAESVNRRELVANNAQPAISTLATGEATDDEIAAVLAVIAKLVPDKPVASIRMISK